MAKGQTITPCLWFDNQAEEAVDFYTSLLKNSKKLRTSYYGKSSAEVAKRPEGSILTIDFEILGQPFVALNGGPQFKLTEAVSFMILCDSQQEIDELWGEMTADGGRESFCGWLKDKFGVSWQIIPRRLDEMAADPDPEKIERVMACMLKMKKLDLAELEAAYQG